MSYESEEEYNEAMSDQAYNEAEYANDEAYAEHLGKVNHEDKLAREEQRDYKETLTESNL